MHKAESINHSQSCNQLQIIFIDECLTRRIMCNTSIHHKAVEHSKKVLQTMRYNTIQYNTILYNATHNITSYYITLHHITSIINHPTHDYILQYNNNN